MSQGGEIPGECVHVTIPRALVIVEPFGMARDLGWAKVHGGTASILLSSCIHNRSHHTPTLARETYCVGATRRLSSASIS